MGVLIRLALGLAAAVMGGALAWADAVGGVVTIVEGPVQVVRGVNRSPLAPGVRLKPGDLLSVDSGGLLRIETAEGVRADLAAGARAMWMPAVGPASGQLLHWQAGWLKLSVPTPRGAGPVGVWSSGLQIEELGVGVFFLEATQSIVFAETGKLTGTLRGPAGPGGPTIRLKPGELLSRPADKPPSIAPVPTPAFLARLPVAFRDTLPSRYSAFAARDVALKPGPVVGFDDVQEWLTADPATRKALLPRWRALMGEAAFRGAIRARLSALPEWKPLFSADPVQTAPAAGQRTDPWPEGRR